MLNGSGCPYPECNEVFYGEDICLIIVLGDTGMLKKLKCIAVAATVVSIALSNTAFAGVIYAPGIKGGSEVGPSGGGSLEATPGQTQNVANQSQTPVNTALGTAGQGVEADPILGVTPVINAVMINADGSTQPPFSTDTGAATAEGDAFQSLWLCYDRAVGDVYYRVFTAEHGWTPWAMNEMRTPNYGDGAKITAVQIRTKGHTANIYDVYYRATLSDGTQLGWAHNGEAAGAFGNGKHIKALELKLFKKGTATTGGYQQGAAYEGVVIGADGRASYSTFDGRAFTGWAYDTNNNKYYFKDNQIVTGWQYIDGYKYYFDDKGIVVTDLEPVIGLTGDYIIKLNKPMKTLTVYAKDGDNGYIIPVKSILTTVGKDTPLGTFKAYEGYRWKYMHPADGGAIYCQYLLRFKNGYILHSIIYQGAADSYKLVADTYNQLGKNQSDGCVRMLSGDAAWVYYNCGVGTQITIYEDEWVTGPFDRPAIEQAIPRSQNFDPTDPVIVKKQQEADAVAKAAAEAAQREAATGIAAEPQELAQ